MQCNELSNLLISKNKLFLSFLYSDSLQLAFHIIMETSYQTLIASRGWHVYGQNVWLNPQRDETLRVKKEESHDALIHDPHSVAFTRKSRARLTPDVVGHFPLEISRYVWFFLNRGGRVTGMVHDPRYRRSPIPMGGLEIIIKVTFTIAEEKKRYLERLRELIAKNYETPDENRETDERQGKASDVIDEEVSDDDTLDIVFMDNENDHGK